MTYTLTCMRCIQGLGNASDSSCAFQSGLRYCAKWYSGLHDDTEQDEGPLSSLPARVSIPPHPFNKRKSWRGSQTLD